MAEITTPNDRATTSQISPLIRRSRLALAIGATVALGVGISAATVEFVLQTSTANLSAEIDHLGNGFYYGGPVVIVLGALALLLRWRLSHVIRIAKGRRAKSIVVLVLSLILVGVALELLIFWGLWASEGLYVCNTQGC